MRSDFSRVTVDEAVELILDHRGRTPKKLGGDFTDHGVQVISAKNVYDHRLHADESRRFVSPEMALRWMPNPLNSGDVLLTSEAPLGQAAYLNGSATFCLGQRLFGLRARPGVANGRFLYYALISPTVQARLHARASGTTAQGIKQSELRQVELDLPTLPEQERIASVLGALDDKVDSNRRQARLLEELAQTEFQARFVDFVGMDQLVDSEIGPVPKGWDVKPLVETIEINPRVSIAKGQVTPFVAMADVAPWATRPDAVGERPFSGGCRFEPGDTLMARITGCIEHGKGAFVDFIDEPGAGSTEFLVLRARPPLTREAVFFLSRMERLRSNAIASMTGSSGRQRVQIGALHDFKLATPPDDATWSGTAELMRSTLRKTRALWSEARILTSIRDALLPKLISGQIRVPDIADPGEVIEPLVDDPA
jgi:type I restriction enzyme, S subunit